MLGSGCRVSPCSHIADFGKFQHGLVACFRDHPTCDRGKQLHLIWTCVNTTRIKKLHEVTGMVEKWKMNTRRLMVDFKEELSSGLKTGILVEMLPGDVAGHLSQKISDADQFQDANEMISRYVETKWDFDWRWTTSSSTTGISAFTSRTTRETWTWCTKARAATSTVIATAAPSCCKLPWEVLDAVLLLRTGRTGTCGTAGALGKGTRTRAKAGVRMESGKKMWEKRILQHRRCNCSGRRRAEREMLNQASASAAGHAGRVFGTTTRPATRARGR